MATNDNTELDVIKFKIKHLESEIALLSEFDPPKTELQYDDVVNILKSEIASHKDCLAFETKKQQLLLSEEENLLKCEEQENSLLKCINDYLEANNREDSIMDETKEIFFKLEILHRKILSFIRRFSNRYFPVSSLNCHKGDLFLDETSSVTDECGNKKSLFDILCILIIELGLEKNIDTSGVLYVDDTVPKEYINLLEFADIIERFKEDPNQIKLK